MRTVSWASSAAPPSLINHVYTMLINVIIKALTHGTQHPPHTTYITNPTQTVKLSQTVTLRCSKLLPLYDRHLLYLPEA